MRQLIHDNNTALRQAQSLLEVIEDQMFRHPVPACYDASVGAHLRHVLDHYESFFQGLGGAVDYESRQRDPRLETDRSYALTRVSAHLSNLTRLLDTPSDLPLRVRLEGCSASGAEAWGDSSASRELEFLLSHTIHHFALIGVCCRLQGIHPPATFGIAPSTLRHRQNLAAAAS